MVSHLKRVLVTFHLKKPQSGFSKHFCAQSSTFLIFSFSTTRRPGILSFSRHSDKWRKYNKRLSNQCMTRLLVKFGGSWVGRMGLVGSSGMVDCLKMLLWLSLSLSLWSRRLLCPTTSSSFRWIGSASSDTASCWPSCGSKNLNTY